MAKIIFISLLVLVVGLVFAFVYFYNSGDIKIVQDFNKSNQGVEDSSGIDSNGDDGGVVVSNSSQNSSRNSVSNTGAGGGGGGGVA